MRSSSTKEKKKSHALFFGPSAGPAGKASGRHFASRVFLESQQPWQSLANQAVAKTAGPRRKGKWKTGNEAQSKPIGTQMVNPEPCKELERPQLFMVGIVLYQPSSTQVLIVAQMEISRNRNPLSPNSRLKKPGGGPALFAHLLVVIHGVTALCLAGPCLGTGHSTCMASQPKPPHLPPQGTNWQTTVLSISIVEVMHAFDWALSASPESYSKPGSEMVYPEPEPCPAFGGAHFTFGISPSPRASRALSPAHLGTIPCMLSGPSRLRAVRASLSPSQLGHLSVDR